jgi:hypothetical protein
MKCGACCSALLSEQNATLLARLDALETLINKGNV